jgi:hypothetical protein
MSMPTTARPQQAKPAGKGGPRASPQGVLSAGASQRQNAELTAALRRALTQ